MLRQGTNADSAYYAAFVTPGNGIVVQYRPTQGLKTQVISGPSSTVPTYLMIARSGGTYCTYTSSDGVNWTYVIGTCFALTLSSPTLAGLAITSANTGTLSVAAIDTVTISTTAPTPPTNCPSGWTCTDVGYPLPPGSQSLSGGTWTVQAGGNDIWNNFDQFRFVSQTLSADGSVSAHITSQTNTNPWAKAGVMLRQTTDPGSPYYAVFVTPSSGIAVQYRSAQGGASGQLALVSGTVPAYLMVARAGSTYTAYTSIDGANWTAVTGSSITISMSGPVLAGLAATSHNGSALGTITYDTVNISTTLSCPAGWSCADIGSPTPAGSQAFSAGTWTIQAGGADIFGTSDQFHYVWQSLAADGSVSAHVASQTNSSGWAKAGVMLRQSSDPTSAYYAVFVSPSNGIAVQYRKTLGGKTTQLVLTTGTVPTYLMVARSGTTYTAYTSSDGTTWTLIAGSSFTVPMSGAVLAGMAATSHNAKTLSTITYDTVNISTCPVGWNCADIGNPVPTGGQTFSAGTWTIQAGGNDIWGTADTFHYVWQSLAADGSVSAHVATQSNSSVWAKAGVMLRQTSDPGSPYYAIFVTPG